MELEGKRVLLSGATGGLGRAIAEELAANGANLVLSSRKEAELEELRDSLPGGASRHELIVADLAEEGAPERLVLDADNIDILVANAALPASGKLDDFSHQQLARAVRVNLEAPIRMTRELAPKLLNKGEGHLVYISSLAGRAATARSSLYAATKFGLRGFAFGLREDMVPKGIGVSIISPGFVRDAGMFHDADTKPPPGMGTTTPKKVGKAVVRAIRRNRSEIAVAPRRQRIIASWVGRHPEWAGRLTRRESMHKIADDLAAGQTDKR